MQRSRISCGSCNNNAVFHCAVLFKSTNDTGNVRSLLADSNVNADYVLAFLVKDGINSNGSFAGARGRR